MVWLSPNHNFCKKFQEICIKTENYNKVIDILKSFKILVNSSDKSQINSLKRKILSFLVDNPKNIKSASRP